MNGKHLLRAVLLLCGSTAVLGAVPWINPDGSAGSFDWANGQNDNNDCFGSPLYVVCDELWFFPDFDVADGSGVGAVKSATMDVDISRREFHSTSFGAPFLAVEIFVYGDYQITAPLQTGGNTVYAVFEMIATVASHPMSPFIGEFLFSTEDPTPGGQQWESSALISFLYAVPDVRELHLQVNGTIWAIGDGQGGTASITVQEMLVTVRGGPLTPPYDFDSDGDLDLDDYAYMEACMSGPNGELSAECARCDFDLDGDVDLYDFADFQLWFSVCWRL